MMKLIVGRLNAGFALLLALGFLLGGCASPSEPSFNSAPALEPGGGGGGGANGTNDASKPVVDPSSGEYRARVGDLVTVTFSGTIETIMPHEERIKEDGNITLPLVGAVKALGKTTGELQDEIHSKYVPKYYVRLTVTVRYAADLSYTTSGEVRSPGPKSYIIGTTVTQAIAASGGFTEFARKSKIQLRRNNGKTLTIDYNKAIKNPKDDPKVYPGDFIDVPRTWL